MKELRILTIADQKDALFLKSNSVDVKDVFAGDIPEFIDNLVYTLILTGCKNCGIAAPQVGRALRIIAVSAEGSIPTVMINPRITKRSLLTRPSTERCFSVPNGTKRKTRHFWVEVEYLDRDGALRARRCTGSFSCIVQHEIDHLDGKLIA